MRAQHAAMPCIQPQNAFRAGRREEARRKGKDKNKTTTQAIIEQCEGSLRWDVKDHWL